ncbi:MAG: ATP-binding cassette domain-containing protein [Saprospiraceae bacterium]|nr:ATP-binding cassette domain-containing protein [Saprospiraceae bacterium]
MKPVIEIKNIWKQYEKGADRRYKSIRDTFSELPSKLFKKSNDHFWALQDISFDVHEGESIGIIGKNGAGKSTLLKILSRITPPTRGEIKLRGRVSSLLEVGTGFHPELTGRENVYFNGSIAGMKYQEIKSKFEEIVEFAEVGSFIDTPMKHFSSGMQMRLAFSVAAHLETEVFIIDEVLAVGDIAFQKKCIEKIKNISVSSGKTIIFVTHDFNVLQSLCEKTCLITDGKLSFVGKTENVLKQYFSENNIHANQSIESITHRNGSQSLSVVKGKIWQEAKEDNPFSIQSLSDINIELTLILNRPEEPNSYRIDLGLNNALGQRLTWLSTQLKTKNELNSEYKVVFKIISFPFVAGTYDCNIYIENGGVISDWLKNVLPFTVFKGNHHEIPSNQGNVILNYTVE